MGANIGCTKKSCPGAFEKIPVEKQDPKLHRIKFLIQDKTNKPLPDIIIKITMPNGRSKIGKSDKDGIVEIKNIKPGSCKIESDWKNFMVYFSVLI